MILCQMEEISLHCRKEKVYFNVFIGYKYLYFSHKK